MDKIYKVQVFKPCTDILENEELFDDSVAACAYASAWSDEYSVIVVEYTLQPDGHRFIEGNKPILEY